MGRAAKRHVLFVHGGGEGAHEADQELAASLQYALGAGYEVRSPKMPTEEGPEYGAWRDRISENSPTSMARRYSPGILLAPRSC